MFFKRTVDLSTLKAYSVGLKQVKAHRVLKQTMATALDKYQVTHLDWYLLGLLAEQSGGLRPSVIADQLGIDAPLVTTLISKLQSMQLIELQLDPEDHRAKHIALTTKGEEQVQAMESAVRAETKALFNGLTPEEIHTYIKTLELVVDNSQLQTT